MITGLKKLCRVRRIILAFLYPTFFPHLDIVENFLKKYKVPVWTSDEISAPSQNHGQREASIWSFRLAVRFLRRITRVWISKHGTKHSQRLLWTNSIFYSMYGHLSSPHRMYKRVCSSISLTIRRLTWLPKKLKGNFLKCRSLSTMNKSPTWLTL